MPSLTSFTRLELKYCELCGGLWVRLAGDSAVYCPACVPKMAGLPAPSAPRPDAQPAGDARSATGAVLVPTVLALLPCGLDAACWGWCL